MNAPIPPDLKEKVLLAVANTPSKTRAQARWRAAGYTFLAAIPMLALLFLAGGPGRSSGRPRVMTLAILLGCLVISVLSTWIASARTRWMLGHGRALMHFVAFGMPILYTAWISAFYPLYEPPFERLGIRCFFVALASAPWPFMAMAMWRKLIEPHQPSLLGGVFGAVAGMWAGLVVVLFCPLTDPGHVARGHLLPFVVLIAAGALLGKRLFAVSSS